ncbi:hypothetical protein ATANTOWER_029649, partial [Ataeniobius toweri]|nr:hypothetical protein [Ataeniobius toweri]
EGKCSPWLYKIDLALCGQVQRTSALSTHRHSRSQVHPTLWEPLKVPHHFL